MQVDLYKNASQSAIIDLIIPFSKRLSDDNATTSLNLNSDKYKSFNLNNGDSVNIIPISVLNLTVEVIGRVKIQENFHINRH